MPNVQLALAADAQPEPDRTPIDQVTLTSRQVTAVLDALDEHSPVGDLGLAYDKLAQLERRLVKREVEATIHKLREGTGLC